jgi:hypothetical protein
VKHYAATTADCWDINELLLFTFDVVIYEQEKLRMGLVCLRIGPILFIEFVSG